MDASAPTMDGAGETSLQDSASSPRGVDHKDMSAVVCSRLKRLGWLDADHDSESDLMQMMDHVFNKIEMLELERMPRFGRSLLPLPPASQDASSQSRTDVANATLFNSESQPDVAKRIDGRSCLRPADESEQAPATSEEAALAAPVRP